MSTNRRARQRVRPLPTGSTLYTPNASPARQAAERRSARPLPTGSTLYTPNASPTRQAAERRSARPLLYLHQLPRWVLPVALALLLVVGLAVKGPVGAVALGIVAVILSWLAALAWPRLAPAGQAGRVLVIAALFAVAGYQAAR